MRAVGVVVCPEEFVKSNRKAISLKFRIAVVVGILSLFSFMLILSIFYFYIIDVHVFHEVHACEPTRHELVNKRRLVALKHHKHPKNNNNIDISRPSQFHKSDISY